MAFAKARTALAQLEEKLRRQLGLAGEVGATFLPELTPVIVVADLREAGNASNQGRAFSWCFTGVPGASGNFSLRFEQDCFVDRLWVSNTVTYSANIWLLAPGQAPAIAVAALAGTWTDRKVVATDQVPLTQSAAFGALTGVNVSDQNRIWGMSAVAGGAFNGYAQTDVNIMVPAGGHLNWNLSGAAGTAHIGLRGRIWP